MHMCYCISKFHLQIFMVYKAIFGLISYIKDTLKMLLSECCWSYGMYLFTHPAFFQHCSKCL